MVNSSLTSKRSALKELRSKAFGYGKLYVVGDEINDFEMIDGLGTFLTTSNAPKAVKDKAEAVATSKHARGVRELLMKIFKQ